MASAWRGTPLPCSSGQPPTAKSALGPSAPGYPVAERGDVRERTLEQPVGEQPGGLDTSERVTSEADLVDVGLIGQQQLDNVVLTLFSGCEEGERALGGELARVRLLLEQVSDYAHISSPRRIQESTRGRSHRASPHLNTPLRHDHALLSVWRMVVGERKGGEVE